MYMFVIADEIHVVHTGLFYNKDIVELYSKCIVQEAVVPVHIHVMWTCVYERGGV